MKSNERNQNNLRVQGFSTGLSKDTRRVVSVRVQTIQQGPPSYSRLPLKFPQLRRAKSAVSLDEVRRRVWTPYAVDVVVSRLQECGISANDTAAMLWKQYHDDTLHDREQTIPTPQHERVEAEEHGGVLDNPNSDNPTKTVFKGNSERNCANSEENGTISKDISVSVRKGERKFARTIRSAPVRRVCHVCRGFLPSHNNGQNTLVRSPYPASSTPDNQRKTGIRPMTADASEIKGILKRLDREEDRPRPVSCQFPDREVTFQLNTSQSNDICQCSCGNRTSLEVLSASPGRHLKRENVRYKPCTTTMTFPVRKMWNFDDCSRQIGQTYYAYRAQRLKQQGEIRKAFEHERKRHIADDKTHEQKAVNDRTNGGKTFTGRSVSSLF